MIFGTRLKKERTNKKLTQEELGKLINKTKNGISQYETGKREPDLSTLNKFAEIFNCTVDYLIGRTDKREATIIEGEEIPKELKDIGIEYLEISKELKEKGFKPQDIKELIKAIEKMRNSTQ